MPGLGEQVLAGREESRTYNGCCTVRVSATHYIRMHNFLISQSSANIMLLQPIWKTAVKKINWLRKKQLFLFCDMKQLERQVWTSFVLIFMSFLPCFVCLSKLLRSTVGIDITKPNGNVQWEARRMFSKNTENYFSLTTWDPVFSVSVHVSLWPYSNYWRYWPASAKLKWDVVVPTGLMENSSWLEEKKPY